MAGQTVVVSVLADTKKFAKSMKGLADETGMTKLGNGVRKVGTFLKNTAKAGVAAAAGVAALALKGGFERAMNIEDAQAALKGLGHDTKSIDKIMGSALASVKGTAFGLGDAAQIASTAVAAGIEPGEKLTRTLKLTSNAAALARVGLGEMGSILNKVWTNGKVGTEELNQLADRGIPIWTKLAEHYGVSGDELRKMVSQGKVDAETFAGVLEGTVGTAAEEMGKTTRGSWQNMLAALSRGGESFLKGIFPLFKEGFGGITKFIDDLAPKAEKAGAAVASWITGTLLPALRSFGAWFAAEAMPRLRELGATLQSEVLPRLQQFGSFLTGTVLPGLVEVGAWVVRNREWLTTLAVGIAAAVAAWQTYVKVLAIYKAATNAAKAAQIAFNLAMRANPIGLIITAVMALVAALVWFFTKTEVGQKIFKAAWAGIQKAVKVVVDWFNTSVRPVIEQVWAAIQNSAAAVAAWYQQNLAPVFEALGELFGAIFARIGQGATWLWENIIQPWFSLMQLGWETLWTAIQAAWEVIGPPIMAAITAAIEVVKAVWTTVWNVVKAVFTGVWNVIKTVVTTVLGVIKGLIKTATALIKGDWTGAWNAIKGVFTTVWNGIKSVVTTVINTVRSVISSVLNGIRSTVSAVLNGIKSVFSAAWNSVRTATTTAFNAVRQGIVNGISNALAFIRDFPNKIKGIFSAAGSWLRDAGVKVIRGFLDGINNMFGSVKSKLSSLTNMLPSWKGPARRDATILEDAGELVIAGFVRGLESQYATVRRSLAGLTSDVAATDMGTIAAPRIDTPSSPELASYAARNANPNLGVPGDGGGAQRIYQITVQVAPTADQASIGRELTAAIAAWERQNGGRRA